MFICLLPAPESDSNKILAMLLIILKIDGAEPTDGYMLLSAKLAKNFIICYFYYKDKPTNSSLNGN